MKMEEVINLIYRVPKGFKVRFDWNDNGILRPDKFPEYGLIPIEEIAWKWAELLAKAAPGKIVDVHVVDDKWVPVKNYKKRMIQNR